MMNTEAKNFPPLEKWQAQSYKPDVYGRWIGVSRRRRDLRGGRMWNVRRDR